MRKFIFVVLFATGLFAQSTVPTLRSDAVFPRRFLAAHGQRAVLEGYSSAGLEAWIYPYQVLRGYKVSVRRAADSSAVDSLLLLRRVEVTPSTVTRIYTGPDFVLREELFVPTDRAAATITYSVDSDAPVDIVLRFAPVMDLMWPAASGGESAQWSAERSGYLLRSGDGALALVASPQTSAHDALWNSTQNSVGGEIGMTLRVTRAQAAVLGIVAETTASATAEGLARDMQTLLAELPRLHEEAAARYAKTLEDSLQIETPEPAVNSALQWAAIALEQAWVCEEDIGCAYVAGYGPSRAGRRPQYQWFFAGDGMISASAATTLGNFARARQELEFILKYQDANSGMMWHELTLSAGRFDWKNKFPYMYVHVDLAFQFLSALENYVEKSGDVKFAQRHWPQIEAAYRYCRSTLDASTGLPRIPESKSGANEQDKLSDELELSAAWVEAARAYAELATAVGEHAAEAAAARQAADIAARQISPRYWDAQSGAFLSAHTQDGRAVRSRSLAALSVVEQDSLASEAQRAAVLDQLSSSDFQTDWGSRGLAPGAGYAPAEYSRGSVWPIATAGMATALWSNQRPWTAEAVWRTLFAGASIDSLGHLPEVYNGEFFQTQEEGVPEQTWSSASMLHATVDGMLGVQAKIAPGGHDVLTFAPNLPATWEFVRLRNVRLGARKVGLELHRAASGYGLTVENPGDPFTLEFRPLLPLGAHLMKTTKGAPAVALTASSSGGCETRAATTARIARGTTHLTVEYQGGISLLVPNAMPGIGDRNSGYKLHSACIEGGRLHLRLDARRDAPVVLRLRPGDHLEDSSMERTIPPAAAAGTEYRALEEWIPLPSAMHK